MKQAHCQVAIVGAGPGGLAAAIELKRLGVRDVVLIDREPVAGGIPRHCGHSPFGLREFQRILSGPQYAQRLVKQAITAGISLQLNTTVTALKPGGMLSLSTPDGTCKLAAEKVILCTGNRESPRSARLVSGTRPLGIVTTSALQSMVYLKQRRPFKHPVIIGSELVAFSALLTCRHAGINVAAMVEPETRITALRGASLLPRLLGTPLLLDTSLQTINGQERLESVTLLTGSGKTQTLPCDGVIFSGQFVPEASLITTSHLHKDHRSGGPVVDQYYRCSDPGYFACGNLLHPVDTAGWCWSEGRRVAACVNAALKGALPAASQFIAINTADEHIKYVTPQRIALPDNAESRVVAAPTQAFQLRFASNTRGHLQLRDDKGVSLIRRKLRVLRERRVLLPLPTTNDLHKTSSLSLGFHPQKA